MSAIPLAGKEEVNKPLRVTALLRVLPGDEYSMEWFLAKSHLGCSYSPFRSVAAVMGT
jgi:hypothetical protein